MKKITIAVVLAVLLMLAMPSAVSAAGITVVDRTGDGEWIEDTWEVQIFPGETKSTTLTLYNSCSSSLEVEITITPDSLDNGNLVFELDRTSFAISRRSYGDVILTVKANGSATPGTYTTELTIKSEVPPAPSPTPPAPEPTPEEPVEPTVPEEPEPVEPEPEEPEVVEPVEEPEEEPEVIEPEEEEPEVVEPEVIEPGEEEEEEVIVPPGIPWGLIRNIVGGLAVAGGIGYWLWLWRRRRKEANYGT